MDEMVMMGSLDLENLQAGGLKNDKGDMGECGPSSGGVTYVRWGRTVCPNTARTELVYTGRAAGSYYNQKREVMITSVYQRSLST